MDLRHRDDFGFWQRAVAVLRDEGLTRASPWLKQLSTVILAKSSSVYSESQKNSCGTASPMFILGVFPQVLSVGSHRYQWTKHAILCSAMWACEGRCTKS